MANYEAYREGTLSKEEYLDGKESFAMLQVKADQDISEANIKLKELRKKVTVGLEIFDSKGNEIKLNKLNRELVEQLIERIVVGDDRIEIEWKFRG